ncbi:hypothetical protein QM012_005490 [Aureobasidium pullulans]|uniref:Uncharacterized protein n=1 Tax=Aureobasidium pullulans TaxID=5580 RepID=A0ABR0T5P8_AURPU
MSPIPKFHSTNASVHTVIDLKATTKTFIAPPRKLETLTVGCKISIVLVFPHYDFLNSDIEEKAKKIIRDALSTTTFTDFECSYCSAPHVYQLPVSSRDPSDSDKARNKYWHVDVVPNAHLHNDGFENLSDRYYVVGLQVINFKVYVGNNHHGMHMDVARSLMAIFTALERQFDAINMTPRIGEGLSGQPAPLASKPHLYHYVSDDRNTIQEEAGEGSLDVSRVWDEKLIAYNPEYVHYCMKKPTVVFCSHAGTLDINEQLAWIDLCCILIELCYDQDLRHIENWTRKRWSEPHNQYTILLILHHVGGYIKDTSAHYKKVVTPIKDPASTIVQPHVSALAAEWKCEIAHSDPLKETKIPATMMLNCADYKDARNVRDKVRHNFDLRLYGRFPMDTVTEFVRDHHEKKALFTSDWRELILHTV